MELSMNKNEWKEFEAAYNEMMKPFKIDEPEHKVPPIFKEFFSLGDQIEATRKILRDDKASKIKKYFARKEYLTLYPKYNRLNDYIAINKIKDHKGQTWEDYNFALRYSEDGQMKKYFLNDDGTCSYIEYVEIKL